MRFIAAILFLLSVFCGCKKDPTSSNQDAVPVDPNKPNANKNIILEVKNGEYAMINVFTNSLEGVDGNIILSGIVNNEYVLLKVKKSGETIWKKNTPFMIKKIVRLPSSNTVFLDGIVTMGDVSNGMGFMIYDDNGNIVNENYISLPDYKMWTNSIGVLNSTNDSVKFAGCGKIQATSQIGWYPFLINFTLLRDGGINLNLSKIFTDGRLDYKGMIINNDSSGLKYYICGDRRNADSTIYYPFICRLNDSLKYDWFNFISTGYLKNPSVENNQFFEYDNSLLVIGNHLVKKVKNSQSTGDWSSGFLVSYGKDGTFRSVKSLPITDYDDVFISAVISESYLYVYGLCAAGLNTLTGNYAGLGLLVKYNLSNGEQVWAMKIGQDYYQSGINTISVQSGHAYIAGWANLYTIIMGCKSWYADIDISKPPLGKVDYHYAKEFILTPSNSYNNMKKMLLLK